jgi:hypothetical protein
MAMRTVTAATLQLLQASLQQRQCLPALPGICSGVWINLGPTASPWSLRKEKDSLQDTPDLLPSPHSETVNWSAYKYSKHSKQQQQQRTA